jgi:hypothetical protein
LAPLRDRTGFIFEGQSAGATPQSPGDALSASEFRQERRAKKWMPVYRENAAKIKEADRIIL